MIQRIGERAMSADPTGKTVQTIVEAVVRKPGEEGDRLVLPKFQRTVVWSRPKQIDLVDSVHRQYPVGAVLWWKAPGQQGAKTGTTYVLVDGLQRTMALKSYLDEPLAYKSYDLLPEDVRARLRDPIQGALAALFDHEEFGRGVNAWLHQTKRCEQGSGFHAEAFLEALNETMSPPAGWAEQVDSQTVRTALDSLQKWIETVQQSVIPVITWDGPKDDLQEVFRRLNRTAQKLTAYDLLAAQWYETAVRMSNKVLQDEVDAKYEALATEDMEVIDTRSFEDLPNPEDLYNLYEYLVAVGRLQARKRPSLFKPPREDEFHNPGWAFSAATIGHGLRIANMESLPDAFGRESAKVLDPSSFEVAFVKSISLVWESLSPFLDVNLNRKEDTPADREHAELQMVAMVCSVLVNSWHRDEHGVWSRREGWQGREKKFRMYLPQHYLYEIIEDEWSGAGDTKAFNRVWATEDTDTPSERYMQPLDREILEAALDRWFEREGIERVQKERQFVRSIEKMMLRFVYSQVLRVYQDKGLPFDIEHLFPVKRLVTLASEDKGSTGWPISSVANLALLDIALNRRKRALTISEALKLEKDSKTRLKKRRRLEELILCSVADVNIPKSFSRDKYVAFLRGRWATLKSYILEGLYPDA
jgi:hypothetical protein